jgi:DNA-binding SARP family transcriptional activator
LAAVEVSVLSGFRLRCAGSVVRLPMSAQRVIAFLAMQRGSVERPYVAGTLWSDMSEPHARANLRTVLWRLPAPARAAIRLTGTQMALADVAAVDLRLMSARARRIIRGERPEGDDATALSIAGDVLPGWYDDWLLMEREHFRQLRLHALESLCERLAAEGRFGEAVDIGSAAVAVEPLRESAHRVLIKAHVAEGNPVEALRDYRLYSRLLDEKLGLEPTPLITRLLPVMAGSRK